MSHPRDDHQDDLFRPSLENIINLRHPLVRLAAAIDWDFLAGRFWRRRVDAARIAVQKQRRHRPRIKRRLTQPARVAA